MKIKEIGPKGSGVARDLDLSIGRWLYKWSNTVKVFAHTRVNVTLRKHLMSTRVWKELRAGWARGEPPTTYRCPTGPGGALTWCPWWRIRPRTRAALRTGGLFIVFTTVMSCAQRYQHSERKTNTRTRKQTQVRKPRFTCCKHGKKKHVQAAIVTCTIEVVPVPCL